MLHEQVYRCMVGLLRCAAVAHGARHNDEDDPASADLGAEGHLHPRLLSQRRGPGSGSDE